jgi:hypothetical protein
MIFCEATGRGIFLVRRNELRQENSNSARIVQSARVREPIQKKCDLGTAAATVLGRFGLVTGIPLPTVPHKRATFCTAAMIQS